MKYKQFHDHQEIEVQEGVGLNFACCDCALVHDLQVRREGEKIFVSFTRNNRATAALRRHYDMPMVARADPDPRRRSTRQDSKKTSLVTKG